MPFPLQHREWQSVLESSTAVVAKDKNLTADGARNFMNAPCLRLTLAVWLICLAYAPAVSAQEPLWGMSYGNTFSVETTVERTSKVTIGDGAEKVHRSTETIVVQYRLAAMQQSEIALQARIVSCRRSGDSPNGSLDQLAERQIGLIEGSQVFLSIDADGVVTGITLGEASGSRVLAGGTGDGKDLMSACWNDKVIGSWLGRPFWCGLPAEKWETDATWERTDEISVGLLGQVSNIVTCTISKATDETAEVSISGNARHRPMLGKTTSDSTLLQFKEVTLTVDKFSGSAKMIKAKQPDKQKAPEATPAAETPKRPWFDSLNLQWQISGEAKVSIGDEERPVVFSQERTERSRLLPGYRIGRPEFMLQPQ